jgi:hypothetical protein
VRISRRTFLQLAASIPLMLSMPAPTLAARAWTKGTHLAPGFNPTLVNQLGLDYVEGIDPLLFEATTSPLLSGLAQLNCRYRHRIPFTGWGMAIYSVVRQLPNFYNEWVVLNEPSLHHTPEAAASMANEIIGQIVASDPTINNRITLNFLHEPHYQDNAWRDAFWNNLTSFTISKLSALGVHCYPESLDPVYTRSFLKNTIRNWQNGRGIGHLPLLLHETGFDDAVVTQEQAAQYIYDFVEAFAGVVWLDGVNWFMWSQTVDMHYVPLVNPQQTKLKKAGEAWALL